MDETDYPFPVTPVFTPQHGEGWAAARHIRAGEIVLRVAPAAAVPNDAHCCTVCAGCFQTEESSHIRLEECPGCSMVSFCTRCKSSPSIKARHCTECVSLKLLQDGRRAGDPDTTALRLILQVACLRGDQRSSQAEQVSEEDTSVQFGPDDVILDNLVDDLDQLMGDADEDLPDEVYQKYMEVCKRIKFLLPAAARASMEALMRLACQAHLNGMDITAPSTDKRKGSQGKSVGEAIYPSAARFNHSCEPSCGLSFDAWGCLQVVALSRVREGEELTICYVDPYAKRDVRHARLRKQYGFECDCGKCARGQ